jgi:uncharacterized membrane protein
MTEMTEMINQMSSWRKIALPASIVFNFFLVALIGGFVWRDCTDEVGFGAPLTRALAKADATLEAQDAAAFGAIIRRDAPRYSGAQRRLVEARREFRRRITADEFDPEGARQALANWRAAWGRFFDDFSETLVEALAQVSPEGRRKLAAERKLLRATPSLP